MWYEAIFPFLLVGALSAIPSYVGPYINQYFLGNKQLRNYEGFISQLAYSRDFVQGNGILWKVNGLESIPDK